MSAFSVSEPFPTFHDRNGQPLEAGFLYIGVAGLDPMANPITVYWDAALTIPAAQPVRTLSGYPSNGGTASALYVNGDDFSIGVFNSQNTLVFSSRNATVRIPLAATTGSISADRVNYTEGGTGSTTRTLTSKLQESVSVFDFMTTAQIADVKAGTLLVDVTAAINAAIAASDDVFFPEGAYRVTNDGTATNGAIQVLGGTAGKVLRGAGRGNAVVHNFGAGPCITSVGNVIFANVSVHICDLTIQGEVGSAEGIFCDYTSQSMFERLDLFQCGTHGIKIQRGAHNSLTDVWARTCGLDGVLLGREAFFTTIAGGTFETNSRHGLNVALDGGATAPSGVTVTGAAFRSNVVHNVNVLDGASDVRLFGCMFDTTPSVATARHLSVDGGAGTSSACLAYGCTFVGQNSTSTVVGVYGNDCEDLSLDGCLIDCTGSDAYALTASAVRTRFVNCSSIIGAKTDASNATTQLLPDGGIYALRRSSSFAGETGFDFGSGYARFDTTLLPDAFRFYAVNAVAIFAVQRFGAYRVWMNPLDGYLYQKNGADPAFTNDGAIVNVGAPVPSYARGALPAGVSGKIIRGTGFAAGAAWNAAAGGIVAGGAAYLFSWDTSFADWRVFAAG